MRKNFKVVKSIIILFSVMIIGLLINSCTKKDSITEDEKYILELKKKYSYLSNYIDEVNSMSIEERRGLLTMVGITDTVLSKETIKTLKDNHVSGVILFNYNIVDEEQLKKLTSDLKKYVNKNMLISIDEEGGEVFRIPFDKYKDISAKMIGDSNSSEYAYNIAYNKAKFLKDMGINMILGPLCDVPSNKDSYIYNRSFSTNVEMVSKMVEATIKAQKDAGIISVVKHFPGHGDTAVNSHSEFPVIDKTLEELKNKELIPFQKAIDLGAEMVLVSHIKNKYIDDTLPASMSEKYRKLLEEDMGFKGVIITDDLVMTGKIESTINYGINLTSNIYKNVKEMFRNIEPDIISCAKVLKIMRENT